MKPYSDDFYRYLKAGSRRSAKEIVPLITELVQPRNVIDVGCGTGTWLAVFKEHGIDDVWGVDGDYINQTLVEIPQERLLRVDFSQPFHIGRTFDLVVSLEVGEHLAAAHAETFVSSLIRLGPIILFSAAVPYQGGQHHINEQWPEYWVELFAARGYAVIDCIRSKVWQNMNVDWWYAQNILLFVQHEYLKPTRSWTNWLRSFVPGFSQKGPASPRTRSLLYREFEKTTPAQLCIINPRKYLHAVGWERRLHWLADDIAAIVPEGGSFIVVDQDCWGDEVAVAGRRALPFLESEGAGYRLPPDGARAIKKLEHLQQSGAGAVVFVAPGWPPFWWRDFYRELLRYLRLTWRCVIENQRLLVFERGSGGGSLVDNRKEKPRFNLKPLRRSAGDPP